MHTNNGNCLGCAKIFNQYDGFYQPLKDWFFSVQAKFPDAHISCAGRGRLDQEVLFQRGATKAHWGQSAHNFNAAIDIFQMTNGHALWDKYWFSTVVAANLTQDLVWYGASNAVFYELPHVEIGAWSQLARSGILKLVE